MNSPVWDLDAMSFASVDGGLSTVVHVDKPHETQWTTTVNKPPSNTGDAAIYKKNLGCVILPYADKWSGSRETLNLGFSDALVVPQADCLHIYGTPGLM